MQYAVKVQSRYKSCYLEFRDACTATSGIRSSSGTNLQHEHHGEHGEQDDEEYDVFQGHPKPEEARYLPL